MARAPSKVLSAAEKKEVAAELKQKIKDAKQAEKEAAAALKAHAKEGKALEKAHLVARKAYDKLVPAQA